MMRRAVFQTDQLTCYDSDGHRIPCAGTGQDGETRSGLPWPVSRFAPAGRRVFDRLSGLMWLRDAGLMQFPLTWEEAKGRIAEFNAGPLSWTYRNLSASLSDVQKKRKDGQRPQPTYSSRRPILRIDHIFVSNHLVPSSVKVPASRIAQMASDHLPLSAELHFNPQR